MIFFDILLFNLCRYFDGYGIIRDIVHSHILQTIALLAMEPPISLDDEDFRNEKVCLHVIEHSKHLLLLMRSIFSGQGSEIYSPIETQ